LPLKSSLATPCTWNAPCTWKRNRRPADLLACLRRYRDPDCPCGTSISPKSRKGIVFPLCELYRGWEGKLPVTMRQSHAGGDKLFGLCPVCKAGLS
jgi:hypothetical protein